jgi:hypothetical protein
VRSLPRVAWALTSRLCKVLHGRGELSRRLTSASFVLTMRSLSQAPHLGGLHRASRVPFRASFFTPGVHPPGATAQRLTVHWYKRWSFPLIPSPRFVAHMATSPHPYGHCTMNLTPSCFALEGKSKPPKMGGGHVWSASLDPVPSACHNSTELPRRQCLIILHCRGGRGWVGEVPYQNSGVHSARGREDVGYSEGH